MTRSRTTSPGDHAAMTRIVWLEGRFRVECTARGPSFALTIYYGRHVMAEQRVRSVRAAWTRAAEICRQLGDGENGAETPASGRRA